MASALEIDIGLLKPVVRVIKAVQRARQLGPRIAQGMAVPVQTVRMAMAVLAVGPILFAFLFVQKYFVRGLTLGGIKDG